MTIIALAMNVGMVGAAFLLGVMTCSLRIHDQVRGMGMAMLAMLLMGGIAGVSVARGPVVEPIWLHYALFALIPYLLGLSVLAALLRSRPGPPD